MRAGCMSRFAALRLNMSSLRTFFLTALCLSSFHLMACDTTGDDRNVTTGEDMNDATGDATGGDLSDATGDLRSIQDATRDPDESLIDASPNPGIENPFDRQMVGLQTDREVLHDGQIRRFHFFAPDQTDDQASYPLVILLHGHGGSVDQLLGLNNRTAPYKIWLDVAAREKIFILVPEGVISPDDKLGWNDCRGDTMTNPSTDDVGFIVELAEAMTQTYPIDAKRIYASGTSNGGHMSFRLAIEAGDRFAAIAPIVASLPKNSKCSSPCLLYTSPSPRDRTRSRMPSSA